MDGIARYSIGCSLQAAFATATGVNESEPPVKLSYANGRATFACDTDPRALEKRVLEALAELSGNPRPVGSDLRSLEQA